MINKVMGYQNGCLCLLVLFKEMEEKKKGVLVARLAESRHLGDQQDERERERKRKRFKSFLNRKGV
jgi:hypothetical protein